MTFFHKFNMNWTEMFLGILNEQTKDKRIIKSILNRIFSMVIKLKNLDVEVNKLYNLNRKRIGKIHKALVIFGPQ